jgi:ABC-type glycerol-3-phosphate transport system permease component
MKILVPLIASGIGVAAFFCFKFSWVELLLARTLTSVQAIHAMDTISPCSFRMIWSETGFHFSRSCEPHTRPSAKPRAI